MLSANFIWTGCLSPYMYVISGQDMLISMVLLPGCKWNNLSFVCQQWNSMTSKVELETFREDYLHLPLLKCHFNNVSNENAWALTYLPCSPHAQSFCLIVLLSWWTQTHAHISYLDIKRFSRESAHTHSVTYRSDSITSTADAGGNESWPKPGCNHILSQ